MKFTRILNPGKVYDCRNQLVNVFVQITFNGTRLSISGVEGPKRDGSFHGTAGQIHPLKLNELNEGWTQEMIDFLNSTWKRWHLNDLRAGTPAQEACIRQAKSEGWAPNPQDYYHSCCVILQLHNLYVDNGYTYGTGWKTEEIPADVLDNLQRLPATKVRTPWI